MSLDPIRALLLAMVILLPFVGYVKGCSDEKSRFDDWKRLQASLAKTQEEMSKRIITENRTAKEKADAENAAARAALDKLRHERPRTIVRFLPATTANAGGPARSCADTAELERALQRLDAGVQGLIDEGDAAEVDLNSARRWAQR